MTDNSINLLKGKISLRLEDLGESVEEYKTLSFTVFYKRGDIDKFKKIGVFSTGIGVSSFYKIMYEYIGDLMETLHSSINKCEDKSDDQIEAILLQEAEMMSALSLVEDLPYDVRQTVKGQEKEPELPSVA